MQKLEEVVLRISPDKFHFLKFILEGYDNLALLSSIENKEGLVVVRYPKHASRDLFDLLTSISKKLS